LKAPEDETMKWKRNGKDGVSPVIAVILMVAITVVLAGVVVLWVTRLSQTQEEAPEVLNLEVHLYNGGTSDEGSSAATDGDYLEFTVLSGSVKWSNYKITIAGTSIYGDGTSGDDWTMSPSTTTTTAGETIKFQEGTSSGPTPIAIDTGETYNIKIINIEQQKVVWEKDVTAVSA